MLRTQLRPRRVGSEFSSDIHETTQGDAKARAIIQRTFTYAELEESSVGLKKLQGRLENIPKLDFYGTLRADRLSAPRRWTSDTLMRPNFDFLA